MADERDKLKAENERLERILEVLRGFNRSWVMKAEDIVAEEEAEEASRDPEGGAPSAPLLVTTPIPRGGG